ncbi:MAG TPA: plastocyanin/azurin family copper-binding protein [Candidatus Saccharimonadales bacterium]|nr:plastocyanin/azurin family copper-binding protein [Candidatus Saccharimonadales bacterium]
MKNINKFLIVFFVCVALFLVFRLLLSPPHNSITPNSNSPISGNKIEVRNYSFSPQKITVKRGTTVTWENFDLVAHTVTMDDEKQKGPNSQLFGKGEKFSYTFSTAGKYIYHCQPHPYMKGEVVVTE